MQGKTWEIDLDWKTWRDFGRHVSVLCTYVLISLRYFNSQRVSIQKLKT